MSRHRNVRALDVDEEYDGYYSCYGHSVEDDFCISPRTEAQFTYNRNADRSSMGSFAEEPEPADDDDGEEQDEPGKLSDVDSARLESCVEAMQDVVGDTIPESVLRKRALEFNFEVEPALDAVLKGGGSQKPQRKAQVDAQKELPVPLVSAQKQVSSPPIVIPKEVAEKNREVSKKDKSNVESKPTVEKPQLDSLSVAKKESSSRSPSVTRKADSKPDKSGLQFYLSERRDEKPLINLVVVGHVDAGKSTLMGHFLYRLGNISQRSMHKFEKESKKLGKGSFMYAWVLDESTEERNRGITMDVAFSTFETPKKSVVLLDAPGHKDFIPNMITGAVQADVAVLVIDSTKGEFETGFEAGGQTREHTMLIRSLGVTELAVAVNKMDNVGWGESRFKEIVARLSTFLRQIGFKESDVTFVPCSGLTGENLISAPEDPDFKKWYSGPTLIDVIDSFQPPERLVDKPFRMSVNNVFKGVTGGFYASGKIATGYLKNGDKVTVMPAAVQATVKSISVEEQSLSMAFAGDNIALQLQGIDINKMSTGSMLCSDDSPTKVTTCFRAKIVIFNISVPITKGSSLVLHYQSLMEQASIRRLVSILNRNTGEVTKQKPRCLSKNSSAIVEIEVNRPICIELYQEFKDLGRFMLRHAGSTVAAGMVTEIK